MAVFAKGMGAFLILQLEKMTAKKVQQTQKNILKYFTLLILRFNSLLNQLDDTSKCLKISQGEKI